MFSLESDLKTVLFFLVLLIAHAVFSRSISIKSIKSNPIRELSSLFLKLSSFIAVATLGYNSAAVSEKINHVVTSLGLCDIFTMSQVLTGILLIIVAGVYYNVMFAKEFLWQFVLYCAVIFCSGFFFVLTNSVFLMFIAYEFILVPTTIVIDSFSKTGKSREASTFMLYWTQLGAIALFFIIGLYMAGVRGCSDFSELPALLSNSQVNLFIVLVFFGFAPKIPVWPFYWWLPEAHVEVPTSFSIILSGASVKFAFLGFVRFIELLGNGDVYWIIALPSLIGVVDAVFKVELESDIKKIVAYQTVAEMSALVAYVSLDVEAFIGVVTYIMITHCWVSTAGFVLVDYISKRYNSRNLEHLYGIVCDAPSLVKIMFLSVFIAGSVPGTSVFALEYYIQLAGSTSIFNFALFAFITFYLVSWSRNIWWVLWGGDRLYSGRPVELTTSEQAFLAIIMLESLPTVMVSGVSL